jgi:hypothetical protein
LKVERRALELIDLLCLIASLPVPSRDEILSSPGDERFDEQKTKITASPVDEDPAAGFERELVQQRRA